MKILTDEEMYDIFKREYCSPESNGGVRYARAIEAAILERIGEPVGYEVTTLDGLKMLTREKCNLSGHSSKALFAIKGIE